MFVDKAAVFGEAVFITHDQCFGECRVGRIAHR